MPKWFIHSDNKEISISFVCHSFILLFLQELSTVTKADFAEAL